MRRAVLFLVVLVNAGLLFADGESAEYSYEQFLLTLTKPSAPIVFDGQVIFTLSSSYRRAGVAFRHDGFSKIYWFKKLELPIENTETFVEKSKKPRESYHDSGLSFIVYDPPSEAALLEYRFIADGLWMPDPYNNNSRVDSASGIKNSVVYLEPKPKTRLVDDENPGLVRFSYTAPPGETITLAGSFNNWDPFMYQMPESEYGRYSLDLYLPAGTYQYIFFHRGERRPDPYNSGQVYLRDGGIASVLTVK